ncbi:Spermatogenesis-associated protein 5-like protein 1 [Gracilariopsis chorda]|uniref:Spermatogenesis-associated protein 5-like protein 1 n=1 Tax=Gracilariopsis chorda TaxID=448386 RepID=A0A2V3IFM7_9FLOR|nr:Spermatogenesis-associated protein 5-like protein 1 [Gracilariopsis chorda]|eukprot:PXF39980.1 Spermatogenesis-associated protein 5-like protein 1 [Gracilariopsis chorda]
MHCDTAATHTVRALLQPLIDARPRALRDHSQRLRSSFPTALLLSGPPGVGKSAAVRLVAHELNLPLFVVNPVPQVHLRLAHALRSARTAPTSSVSLLFVDEIDAVCPASSSASAARNAVPTPAAALLMAVLNPPPRRSKWPSAAHKPLLVVIAATNRPHAVHSALLSPTRFHRQVALQPPSLQERLHFLNRMLPRANPHHLTRIAERTSAFVAADLRSLCDAAQSHQLQQHHREHSYPSSLSLDRAFRDTKPSVLRHHVAAAVPDMSWSSIAGMHHVKRRLKIALEWPVRYAATFNRLALKAPRGILLHGPPGCSKTSLVRAAASDSHLPFIRLSGADIYSCYLGEAERILRDAFSTARVAAPSILFIDEIDAIVGKRSISGLVDGNAVQQRVLSTLLTEMDGIVSAQGVLVIAATNRVDLLDDALLRPGRFDDILKVHLPDEHTRLGILRIHTRSLSLHPDIDLHLIARRTPRYSGADLKALCTEAALSALRELYGARNPATQPAHIFSVDRKPTIAMRHFKLLT